MSGAAEWGAALRAPRRMLTLRLGRLGIEAECRALGSAEVEECLRMGGERGARYALWLSCGALRDAGEEMLRTGEVHTAFDVTERLSYADVLTAAGMILRFSGSAAPEVTADELPDEPDGEEALPAALIPQAFLVGERAADVRTEAAAEIPAQADTEADGVPEETEEARAAEMLPLFFGDTDAAERGSVPTERTVRVRRSVPTAADERVGDEALDRMAERLLERLQIAAGNM